MSPLRNFRTYREAFALSLRNTSVVPYLAAHIKDILIAEEGNPTKLEGNLLNYKKLILIGNISMDILDAQKIPFQSMKPDINLLRYFRNLWWLEDDDLNIYSNILASKKLNSSPTNSSSSEGEAKGILNNNFHRSMFEYLAFEETKRNKVGPEILSEITTNEKFQENTKK